MEEGGKITMLAVSINKNFPRYCKKCGGDIIKNPLVRSMVELTCAQCGRNPEGTRVITEPEEKKHGNSRARFKI